MAFSTAAALEALLFAAGEPLQKKRLVALLEISPKELNAAATELHTRLADTGLSLIEANEEFELRTAPAAAPLVQKFRESELSRDLGKAGLEALAIILYKNGASRGEIDWVRGVNSAAALRSLTLRGLVARTEDSKDRRRIRYQATVEALAHFGVSKITDLPHYEELTTALNEHQEPSTTESEAMVVTETIAE